MSTNTNRITLAEAYELAALLLGRLAPYCQAAKIVGSIRRERPTIGDIELLIVPMRETQLDLFGQPTGDNIDITHETIETRPYLFDCDLTKRLDANGKPRWGMKYKAAAFRGFPVDLFMVTPPAQWGVLSIIRTGSADWAHRLVTPVEQDAFNRNTGKYLGKGWMPAGLLCHKGAIRHTATGELIETPTEQDVFDLIGQPYVEPTEREIP